MSCVLHIYRVLVVITTLGCAAHAQALPSALPTAPPAASNGASLVARSPEPNVNHRARITWVSGQMTITADNASLNGTLRDISRLTSMKITGGVAEERIFGVFGPASPGVVLALLLQGTGSNLLLLEDPRHEVRELVLTPRLGGASPPNPNAARDAEDGDAVDLPPQAMPRTTRQPHFPVLPSPENAAPLPVEQQPSAALPAGSALQPPPPGTTSQEAPNGIKTPQQIYDQLMKLRQQQGGTPQ